MLNKLKIILVLAAIMGVTTIASATSTVVTHYSMGDLEVAGGDSVGSTAATLIDSVSTNDASVTGTPIIVADAAPGGGNYSIQFDGVTDHYDRTPSILPTPVADHTGGTWMLECWAKPTANPSGLDMVMSSGHGGVGYCITAEMIGGEPLWGIFEGGYGGHYDVGGNFTVGEWHHLALVSNGDGTETLYVNGEVTVTSPVWNHWLALANGCGIGSQYTGGGNHGFTGLIDEVYYCTIENFDPATDFNRAYPQASGPNPSDGADPVAIDTDLSWTPGEYNGLVEETVTVWVQGDPNSPIVDGVVATPPYDIPSDLANDTVYEWRVDSQYDPNLVIGDVWSFTTAPLAPSFSGQPVSVVVAAGGSAQFSVTALNAASYAWYHDGNPLSNGGDISGADTDTLTIANIEAADEGDYHCVATGAGSTPSDPAQLVLEKLVGHWPFENSLVDVVGGNDGTATDPNYTTGVDGNVALDVVDATDVVSMSSAALDLNNGWTLAWWCNDRADSVNAGYMVASGDPSGYENFFCRRTGDGSQYGCYVALGYGGGGLNVGSYDRGVWIHHAVTFDPDTGEVVWYINGEALDVADWIVPDAGFDTLLYVGDRKAGERLYDGAIDELRAYNYPMGAEEVASLKFAGDGIAPCVHKPDVDLDDDCDVDLGDFALLASEWLNDTTDIVQ